MKALLLVADGFEDLTVFLPMYRLREEGVEVRLASPMLHGVTGQHGYKLEPDARIHAISPADYDLLIIPDGPAAEKLRLREEAVDVARTFIAESRVAAIGHGLQLLISACALDGRNVTCSPGIRDDVRAAGALYRDLPALVDNNLLTGRGPDDLPNFCQEMARWVRPATVRSR